MVLRSASVPSAKLPEQSPPPPMCNGFAGSVELVPRQEGDGMGPEQQTLPRSVRVSLGCHWERKAKKVGSPTDRARVRGLCF